MAKDGEEAPWVQPLPASSHSYLGRHLYKVADTVIEAELHDLEIQPRPVVGESQHEPPR